MPTRRGGWVGCCPRSAARAAALAQEAWLDDKPRYFARYLHDDGAAAKASLLGADPPRLGRSVLCAGLGEASVTTLERRARQLAKSMRDELNQLAIALAAKEHQPAALTERFIFGVYFHREQVRPGTTAVDGSVFATTARQTYVKKRSQPE